MDLERERYEEGFNRIACIFTVYIISSQPGSGI